MENLKKQLAEKDAKIRELESRSRYDGMLYAVGEHLIESKTEEIEKLKYKLFVLGARVRLHMNSHKCSKLPGLMKNTDGTYKTRF
jgi:hypothetical protein